LLEKIGALNWSLWGCSMTPKSTMKKFGQKKGGTNLLSVVLTTMVVLVMAWVIFLLYCWRSGVLHTSGLNEVSRLLNETESAIMHASHIDLHLKSGGRKPAPVVVQDVHPAPALAVNSIPAKKEPFPTTTTTTTTATAVTAGFDKSDIHVIFSTDCTPFQDWQTISLFHSATVVGQKGHITRIASGCDDEKKKVLTDLYAKLYPNYFVHFTPDFKKDAKTGRKYDFYNKPWGLSHWLKHADPPVDNEVVVALLDPDMIFLRPLTTKIADQPASIFAKRVDKKEIVDKVKKGHPAAQLYGLGAPWTNDNHKKFNRTYICGEDSPCRQPNEWFGSHHYSVGPPYLVHKQDMERIAGTWTKFVPRVYEHYPYLLAEMYAYSMAAAHENLPHLQFQNHMVSNTDVHPGEGWPHVDALTDSCVPPDEHGIYFPGQNLPTVLHFCQFFRAGELGFQKRRVPKDIFTCASPMFKEPPADLSRTTYRIKNGKKEDLKPIAVKRHAFALCVLHRSINAALEDYKNRMCGADANREKSLIITT
jgi:hypothetical protein